MIYIVFALVLVYWCAESPSEAMTWKASWSSTEKINPRIYHLVRLPETLSIIISHLILGYLILGWHGVLMVALVEVMGCILYERIYCGINYKDFWYQKTSKWLFMPHPPIWIEVGLFMICFIAMIILGV